MLEPSKATLICLENGDLSWDFKYNPKEFSLKRSSGYQALDKAEGPWGGLRAECAKPDELSFDLILDTTEPDLGMAGNLALLAPVSSLAALAQSLLNTDSVMDDVASLYKLTLPGQDSKQEDVIRPPLCAFVWGNFQFFGGVTSIDVKLVLFDLSGLPRRAEIQMSMMGQAMHVPKDKKELFGNYGGSYKYESLSGFATSKISMYSLRNKILGMVEV